MPSSTICTATIPQRPPTKRYLFSGHFGCIGLATPMLVPSETVLLLAVGVTITWSRTAKNIRTKYVLN
jgi:hypothetical protein